MVFLLTLLFFATCCQQPILQFKNVVVILADDHALGVTGIYDNDIIRTPSIDRLASEGITFTRAYCNSPICSASRQSLLTGKYPHATGVNLLFTPFPDEQNITIAEHLRDQGYQTAIVGKTHWNNWAWASLYKNGLPDHGFDVIVENGEYRSFLEEDPPPPLPDSIEYYSRSIGRENTAEWMNCYALPHPIDDAHSSGTFFAGEAVKFIEANKEKPFFLWLAFKEPHHPYYFPLEYAGKYNPDEMPLPQGSPEDDRWIPEKFRDLTNEEKRGIIAAYYTSTEYMDKNFGLVLDQINRLGLEENTLVVYISDNGYLLNEHKRFEKHTMWEEAVRQPMIVKAHKSAGQKSEVLVEYIDVMPTVLDYLGIESPPAVQGLSFKNVIENGEQEFREYVFA
jgi:arylsulfatase A-like enzyme